MESDGLDRYSLLCVKLLFILMFRIKDQLEASSSLCLRCSCCAVAEPPYNYPSMQLHGNVFDRQNSYLKYKCWMSSSSNSPTFHHSDSNNAVFIRSAGSTACDNRPCVLAPLQC